MTSDNDHADVEANVFVQATTADMNGLVESAEPADLSEVTSLQGEESELVADDDGFLSDEEFDEPGWSAT